MVEPELIDSIAVVTEEADDPLVRTNILTSIDHLCVVSNKCVLPFVGLLKGSFKSYHLARVSSARAEDVLDFTLPHVFHKAILKR